MKRWSLAVAALLGAAVGTASADYIFLKANVGQPKAPAGGNPMGPMGPFGPAPGGSGGPGGAPRGGLGDIGGPGIGNPGRPPGMGAIGGPVPGGTMGGSFPNQMGGLSFIGGPPGGGQAIEVGAVVEVRASYKALVARARKYQINSQQQPGLGQPPGFGRPPGGLGQPPGGLGRPPGLSVPTPIVTGDDWGAVTLLNIDGLSPGVEYVPINYLTLAKRYEEEFNKVFRNVKADQKPSAEQVLALAKFALTHGLNDKVLDVMKKAGDDNKDNPVFQTFFKVQADLDKPVTTDNTGDLADRLGSGYGKATLKDGKGHYVLFYNLNADQSEVQERLARLEDALHTFYYWFALEGLALPVPAERQPALLASHEPEFQRTRDSLSDPPIVGDGFFARREDLSVFCARPLDERYDMLEKTTEPVWSQGFDRVAILTGKDQAGYPRGSGIEDRAYVGMLALLMKALEDESERTGVSHDASRQLLFASGLLPRAVTVPEWVQFGMGSFFETPLHSPWPTPTGPSSHYLPLYRAEMGGKGNRFEGDAFKTLRKIVTDGYFRGLSPEELKKESPERLKARAATWSLTYFLTQKKRENLLRYFALLKEMPRDLELDDVTLWECFARAFDAYDPKTKQVDEAKMGNLAAQWQSYASGIPLESEELVKEIQKTYDEISKPTEEKPGQSPFGPGGAPPP